MTSRRLRRVAAAVCALMVFGACGSGDEGTGAPPTAAATSGPARPRSTATLRILSPAPGEVVRGDSVTVRLELRGGRILEQASRTLRPNEGHIHLKLDNRTVTLLGSLTERIPGLDPGSHLLEAEFAASDHGPFSPRVISTVVFSSE